MKPTKIIVDTDIDTDCDDAGALAVLHNLSILGHAEILGIICSVPLRPCARFVRSINHWYERSDIRVGLISDAVWRTNSSYDSYFEHRKAVGALGLLYNENFPTRADEPESFEDAINLYRELLSGQPDGSVTICCIGTLTAISQLLRSPSDQLSPLNGDQLVARKVNKLVCMSEASYPEGKDSFNWYMDKAAAACVCGYWPTPIYIQSLGKCVHTGVRFIAETSPENPVRHAYEVWKRALNNGLRPADAQLAAIYTLLTAKERESYDAWLEETANPIRPSWDQLTVIFSVLGEANLFKTKGPLRLSFEQETGEHRWDKQLKGELHYIIDSLAGSSHLAYIVESLMTGPLPSVTSSITIEDSPKELSIEPYHPPRVDASTATPHNTHLL